MADFHKILAAFDLIENQNAQQKSVPQLPAEFNAGDISPVLGAQEKAHPTHNYFVGEEDASHNGVCPDTKEILEGFGDSPVAQAIANRIIRQFPEMITDYGIEHLMHAIEQQAEMVGDVEEIGSSDVGNWIRNIKRDLDSELTREDIAEDWTDAEDELASELSFRGKRSTPKRERSTPIDRTKEPNARSERYYKNKEEKKKGVAEVAKTPAQKRDFKNVMAGAMSRDEYNKKYSLGKYAAKDPKKKLDPTGVYRNLVKTVSEDVATEDVLSTVKKKLGDYLKNIEDEIKSDPDLKDKLDKDIDVVGPAVKTLTTDDGHEIKIHGNEDDGFRITIQNKPAKTTFKDLDEASMAVEMFNARRRRAAMPAPEPEIEIAVEPEVKVAPRAALLQRLKQNNDYVDEK